MTLLVFSNQLLNQSAWMFFPLLLLFSLIFVLALWYTLWRKWLNKSNAGCVRVCVSRCLQSASAPLCCLSVWQRIWRRVLSVSSGPKRRESEIMFSFFVSDMHSRKLQQRLNEKLWLVENYFRAHGSWRSNGPSHIPQCSQNPSKSIHIDLLRIKPHRPFFFATSITLTSPPCHAHSFH